MTTAESGRHGAARHGRLVAADPVFEAGRQGRRAQPWDVEDELRAKAVLGDVTTDLAPSRSLSEQLLINAFAILRAVNVIVAKGIHVEPFGSTLCGKLDNHAPLPPVDHGRSTARVHEHTLIGGDTVSAQAIDHVDLGSPT